MTPVYQNRFGEGYGNCMQAAFATLFDLKLEEVPNFIEIDNWHDAMWEFFKTQGYEYDGFIENPRNLGSWGHDKMELVSKNPGVNGYFYAVVNSPKLFDPVRYVEGNSPTHAVIIDKNLNIVHDPNPAYADLEKYPLADVIGHNGIKYVYILNKL